MKKILFAALALTLASCVKDEPYVKPQEEPQAALSIPRLNECDGDNKQIELYNPSDTKIDLAGYALDKDEADKWTFPAGFSIQPKGFLVVTVKNTPDQGPEFGMSSTKGFHIRLFDPSGAQIDEVECRFDISGGSYGRTADGTGSWAVFTSSTIGASNNGAELKIFRLCLNECDGDNKKLEIYNPNAGDVSLEGYSLDKDEGDLWTAPAGFVVPANGFLVLTVKNVPEQGPGFGMSSTKGFYIRLFDPKGAKMDEVRCETDITGGTYGRETDGEGAWVVFSTGTIGSSNAAGTKK